jgi:uncharacterized phage protein (TIGR01671 family)
MNNNNNNNNREIKFRVWDVAQKIWMNYLYIDIVTWIPSGNNKMDFIYQQYTGLKDRNNKKIYEGDILSSSVVGRTDLLASIAEVKFDNGRFYVAYRGLYAIMLDDQRFTKIVIGNIFQNPELLKK